jgi:glycosyltransferase involved in cell wall biosynthesis
MHGPKTNLDYGQSLRSTEMKFSIIIPNLNSPLVDQTIGALLKQRHPAYSFEVIVVGKDELGLVELSADVHFIFAPTPISSGMARSIGSKNAIGKILCFINADCIPCSDWLGQIYASFQDPEICVLGGGVERSDRRFGMKCESFSNFSEYLVSVSSGMSEQFPAF